MLDSKATRKIASAAFVGALSLSVAKPAFAQQPSEYSITCTPVIGDYIGYCTEWTGSTVHEYWWMGAAWVQTG